MPFKKIMLSCLIFSFGSLFQSKEYMMEDIFVDVYVELSVICDSELKGNGEASFSHSGVSALLKSDFALYSQNFKFIWKYVYFRSTYTKAFTTQQTPRSHA